MGLLGAFLAAFEGVGFEGFFFGLTVSFFNSAFVIFFHRFFRADRLPSEKDLFFACFYIFGPVVLTTVCSLDRPEEN